MGLFESTSKLKDEITSLKQQIEELKANHENEVKILSEKYNDEIENKNEKISDLYKEIASLKSEKFSLKKELGNLKTNDINNAKKQLEELNKDIYKKSQQAISLQERIDKLEKDSQKLDSKIKTNAKKADSIKQTCDRINYCIINYYDASGKPKIIDTYELDRIEELSPSVLLKLHCMDVKDLRKAYNDNNKLIDNLLKEYSSRYTTKTNQAIYSLMVIALKAELQNILSNLKYEKLNSCINDVRSVTQKYLSIASSGNQSIVSTLTRFIGEIEYLFINAVKIEYNYYVKREKAKQEQMALKEQMRQEAEERKALENEKKKIAKEEEKYNTEINKLEDVIASSQDNSEIERLKSKILELQSQLSDVVIKKDEITTLQNGKAGTVYIISNLGSFGEDVFKIGMTRRLDPQDRINELGSASVPFKFDVHSFIFSEDAVALESKMHTLLNDKRVNKVNMRKEFFKVPIDELEKIVEEIDSTAEFKRTILAEEFRQSLSSEFNYTNDYTFDDADEE